MNSDEHIAPIGVSTGVSTGVSASETLDMSTDNPTNTPTYSPDNILRDFDTEADRIRETINSRRTESILAEVELKKMIFALDKLGYDKNQINDIFDNHMTPELKREAINIADQNGFIPDISYMLNDGEDLAKIMATAAKKHHSVPTSKPANNQSDNPHINSTDNIADTLTEDEKLRLLSTDNNPTELRNILSVDKQFDKQAKRNTLMLDIAAGHRPLTSLIDITTDPQLIIDAIKKIPHGSPHSLNWCRKQSIIRQVLDICGPRYVEHMLMLLLN